MSTQPWLPLRIWMRQTFSTPKIGFIGPRTVTRGAWRLHRIYVYRGALLSIDQWFLTRVAAERPRTLGASRTPVPDGRRGLVRMAPTFEPVVDLRQVARSEFKALVIVDLTPLEIGAQKRRAGMR